MSSAPKHYGKWVFDRIKETAFSATGLEWENSRNEVAKNSEVECAQTQIRTTAARRTGERVQKNRTSRPYMCVYGTPELSPSEQLYLLGLK